MKKTLAELALERAREEQVAGSGAPKRYVREVVQAAPGDRRRVCSGCPRKTYSMTGRCQYCRAIDEEAKGHGHE